MDLGIVPVEKVLHVLPPLTRPCARIRESAKDAESGLDDTSPNVVAPVEELGFVCLL